MTILMGQNVDEKVDDLAKNTKSWQFLPAASNRPLAAQPWRQKLINLQNVKLQIFCQECCHGVALQDIMHHLLH